MATAGFSGLRVLALESRRAPEIAKLIRASGGEPTVAPAMREIPLESNQEALDLPIAVTAPEPCTWHELVGALDTTFGPALRGMRAAVQEYGATNPELLAALAERGVACTRVPVYHWALPVDLEPLRNAVRSIVAGEVDVLVFLTAIQVVHLVQVAEQMGAKDGLLKAIRETVVLSIGPSTTEELARVGISPDLEPSHPRMGILIHEGAARAGDMLKRKRSVR